MKCGNKVVYNGNYFCDNFANCGWAAVPDGEPGQNEALNKRLLDALRRARNV